MTALRAPTTTLAGGVEMPRLGLGTWPMDDAEAEVGVARAIELGYRLVDTAHGYGNEVGVGRGLAASGVPREELFVTTKLLAESHGFEAAQAAFAASAERLGLDYLDLFLIHWPMPWQDRYVDAFKGLIKLREDGLLRAVGVSNFKPAHIDRLVEETGVLPDVNQIELNPSLVRDRSRAYHAGKGIATEAWAPLGKGGKLLSEPSITGIAERHGRTPAQVVLRWHIELRSIPVPKSSDPGRMRENLDVFDFALSSEEVAEISSLDRGEAAALDADAVGTGN